MSTFILVNTKNQVDERISAARQPSMNLHSGTRALY
jgi:hypothetical protein